MSIFRNIPCPCPDGKSNGLVPAGPDKAGMPQARISQRSSYGMEEENIFEGLRRKAGAVWSWASVIALASAAVMSSSSK